jgi:hypothetical protein
MNLTLIPIILAALTAANASAGENPVFKELIEKGVTMSDGTAFKLPPPILADGLDAAAQRAAMDEAGDARSSAAELVRKSSAPVVVKVRTARPSKDEGPAVRTVDVWFVAHGDWATLTSTDFLDANAKTKDENRSRVVSKAGVLTGDELEARKLTAVLEEGYEERFVYATFSLFDRVQISATRRSVVTSGSESVLAAGRIDPRFDKDPDYPNQWRPLLRDELANIKPGDAHPFPNAGGYAKITRLAEPARAVFIEFHLVYEEAYGWFDGATLVKQKLPPMVQEKVKTFRRKLAAASAENEEKKEDGE